MKHTAPGAGGTGAGQDNDVGQGGYPIPPHPEPQHLRDRAGFHRSIAALHRLGPRAVAELIAEIATAHDIEADTLDRLERYALLDPTVVAAVGGDGFAPQPLWRVV